MNRLRWPWAIPAMLVVAGCASTPLHYHTLVPASTREAAATASVSGSYHFEVEAVRIPAQVDRFELVARQRTGQIALVEGEVWIAPLADELRSALSLELIRQLGSAEASQVRDELVIAIRVEVERFESVPGNYALIEASWSLSEGSGRPGATLACRSRAHERVGEGYIALVRGHQRAVISLADEIAAAIKQIGANGNCACPAK